MDKFEHAALIAVSMRQSAKTLKNEQMAARVAIRKAAKAERQSIKEQKRPLTLAYRAAMKPLSAAEQLIGKRVTTAIAESNGAIYSRFLNEREGLADANVLAMHVSYNDRVGLRAV